MPKTHTFVRFACIVKLFLLTDLPNIATIIYSADVLKLARDGAEYSCTRQLQPATFSVNTATDYNIMTRYRALTIHYLSLKSSSKLCAYVIFTFRKKIIIIFLLHLHPTSRKRSQAGTRRPLHTAVHRNKARSLHVINPGHVTIAIGSR